VLVAKKPSPLRNPGRVNKRLAALSRSQTKAASSAVGYLLLVLGFVRDPAQDEFLIGGAIVPSLLHQDPRYFYQGTGTNKSRALHALTSPFVCRGDNGQWQPNYSPGDWRVSIVGSRENDSWEMKIWGPNGFERSYTLVGSAGEHQPVVISNVLLKLLPA
jgi:hypothetical protein